MRTTMVTISIIIGVSDCLHSFVLLLRLESSGVFSVTKSVIWLCFLLLLGKGDVIYFEKIIIFADIEYTGGLVYGSNWILITIVKVWLVGWMCAFLLERSWLRIQNWYFKIIFFYYTYVENYTIYWVNILIDY